MLADDTKDKTIPPNGTRLSVYDGQDLIGTMMQIGRTVAVWGADDVYLGVFANRQEAIGALPALAG